MLKTFADKSINHFFQFIDWELLSDEELQAWKGEDDKPLTEKQIQALKNDKRPDVQFLKSRTLNIDGLKAEGLNDKQIEILTTDFIERGLLPAPKPPAPQPASFPQKAIWKNKDADTPVVLIGDAGKDDAGREYFTIEGSDTAIPKDEVTLITEKQNRTKKPKEQ